MALCSVVKTKSDDADKWVQRSFEVKEQAQSVLSYAADTESDIRAYLLTKDVRLLETHENANAVQRSFVVSLPGCLCRCR